MCALTLLPHHFVERPQLCGASVHSAAFFRAACAQEEMEVQVFPFHSKRALFCSRGGGGGRPACCSQPETTSALSTTVLVLEIIWYEFCHNLQEASWPNFPGARWLSSPLRCRPSGSHPCFNRPTPQSCIPLKSALKNIPRKAPHFTDPRLGPASSRNSQGSSPPT